MWSQSKTTLYTFMLQRVIFFSILAHMQRPIVFNYLEPRTFLQDVLGYKCFKNPSFSARAWARQMGLKTHSMLVYLLNGQRRVLLKHTEFLFRAMDLAENEAAYFSNLVQFHNCKTLTEQKFYESQLKALHPNNELAFVELEQFKLVSDWYHMAILEMTSLADFKNDPHWISRRLENKVTSYQVKEAVNRLVNEGLLRIDGEKLVKTHARLMTSKSRTSESIREHHKQVLQLALDATDKQDLTQRYYNSCAMTVDSSKLKEAVDLIVKFRGEMARLMESSSGDQTYQLGIQFFRLTDNNSE